MTDDSVTEVEVGIRLVMIGSFEYFSWAIGVNWCLCAVVNMSNIVVANYVKHAESTRLSILPYTPIRTRRLNGSIPNSTELEELMSNYSNVRGLSKSTKITVLHFALKT